MTLYEHMVKDYVLAPSFFIPVVISIGATLWAWRTSQQLERFKHDLQRDLKAHETTLKVAADIESRFHENDVAALRECQKGAAQLFVHCEELLWQIAHNGDIHASRIDELWTEAVKTYFWLRPWLSVGREPHRKALEESVRSAYTTTEQHYERWSMNRKAGRPLASDLDEDKALAMLEPLRAKVVAELDGWAESLRDYRIELVLKVAKQLEPAGSR
jgi:hypothetical protein